LTEIVLKLTVENLKKRQKRFEIELAILFKEKKKKHLKFFSCTDMSFAQRKFC
jgi:hypothetical protein